MPNPMKEICIMQACEALEDILAAGTSQMRYTIDPENGYICTTSICRVFLAYDHQNDDKKVVIKITYHDDRHLRELFEKETEFSSKPENQHPNIARIYDCHTSACGQPILVMEYAPFTLEDKLKSDEKFDPKKTIGIIEPVCSAADHLHEKGVVHKGIKPSNILIAEDGTVKLGDLALDPKFLDIDSERYLVFLSRLRAPEGFEPEGRKFYPASDLYSIAVVAFEMLTGKVPFSGTYDTSKIFGWKKDEDYIKQFCRENQISEGLTGVFVKAMHPDHSQRYQSGKEFAAALKKRA